MKLVFAILMTLPCIPALAALPPGSRLTANGLGPLKIGMPLKSVNRLLEHPVVPTRADLRAVANCDYQNLPEAPGVSLVFIDDKLARIDITSGPTSSDRGIRLGDALSLVKEKYPDGKAQVLDHVADGVDLSVASPLSPNALSLQFETTRLTRMIAGRKRAVQFTEGCD